MRPAGPASGATIEPDPFRPTLAGRLLVVLATMGIAALATPLLATFIVRTEFLLLYAAVAICAAAARLSGGILATLVGLVAIEYFVLPHLAAFDGRTPNDSFSLLEFAFAALLIVAVGEALRRSRRRLTAANSNLARSLEGEIRARHDAIEQADRLRLLDQVSSILASSLDYQTTIAATARLAVAGGFADWCSVDVLVGDRIRQLASHHTENPAFARFSEVRGRADLEASSPAELAEVIRAGEMRFVPDVSDVFLVGQGRNPDHLAALRGLHLRSAIIVPMTARRRIIGALTLYRVRPSPPFDEGSVALARDIARRAAVSIDNAQLYRTSEIANESKTNFIATMSHELRTPLTAIIGYEELLGEEVSGPVNEGQREQLDRIRVNAKQLLSLIEEVLLHSRIDTGHETVEPGDANVKEIVDQVATTMAPRAAEKGLSLASDPVPASLSLRTDAGKLRQMLLNLVDNAVKFTERGSVTLRACERGEDVVFEVQDTGIGIAPENLDHIFEPFWQVEQTKTRTVGGSGLGLSTTRRLARLLGGRVFVESRPHVGSTFRIVLPRRGRGADAASYLPASRDAS